MSAWIPLALAILPLEGWVAAALHFVGLRAVGQNTPGTGSAVLTGVAAATKQLIHLAFANLRLGVVDVAELTPAMCFHDKQFLQFDEPLKVHIDINFCTYVFTISVTECCTLDSFISW